MKVLEKFSAFPHKVRINRGGATNKKSGFYSPHIVVFCVEDTLYCGISFSRVCQFRSRYMNTFAFLANPSSGMVTAANTNQGEPRTYSGGNRPRGLLQDQVFQRLIDWSIGEASCDVCAVISDPNGFYTNHRLKASEDFPG